MVSKFTTRPSDWLICVIPEKSTLVDLHVVSSMFVNDVSTDVNAAQPIVVMLKKMFFLVFMKVLFERIYAKIALFRVGSIFRPRLFW